MRRPEPPGGEMFINGQGPMSDPATGGAGPG